MRPCYNTYFNSFQKWKIGNELRSILLADSDLLKLVKNNIYPLVAPENVNGDFIIYAREKYKKGAVKQGVYEDECLVAFTVVSDNYDRACDIAEKIDNALYGEHTNDDNITINISLDDSTETFDENKYIETLIYKVE